MIQIGLFSRWAIFHFGYVSTPFFVCGLGCEITVQDVLSGRLRRGALVDQAYQTLLTGDTRALLDGADCSQVRITWGSEPLEQTEAIMRPARLRGQENEKG